MFTTQTWELCQSFYLTLGKKKKKASIFLISLNMGFCITRLLQFTLCPHLCCVLVCVCVCVLSWNTTAVTLHSHLIVLQSPARSTVVTVVFVLGLEHHWLTLPVIKKKNKNTAGLLLRMCMCARTWLLACPSVGGQTSLSPPFTPSCPGEPFNLPCKKKKKKNRTKSDDWSKTRPLPPLEVHHPLLSHGANFYKSQLWGITWPK